MPRVSQRVLLSLCLVAPTLAIAACDGPGGGGGGLVQDAADGTSPDGAVDTAVGGSCTAGERRCSGQVAQQCVNGAFQDLFTCPSTQVCEAGACKAGETSNDTNSGGETLTPDPCAGKECGPDGLGGSCGACSGGESCNLVGQCVPDCVPQCQGKDCGSDGCGGVCGTCDSQFEQCVQGRCELTDVCDCAGAVCGLDNCGNSCGTCPANSVCVEGRCASNEDGLTCVELIDCIYGDTGCGLIEDEAQWQTCAEGCYVEASATGASEFDAYLGCLTSCPQPDGNPATTADDLAYDRCSYQSCADDEAWCVLETSGSGTCIGIIDCFDTCGAGDNDCFLGCYEAATPAAQAALWGLNGCLAVECPDEADQACAEQAFQDRCFDFVSDCQNN